MALVWLRKILKVEGTMVPLLRKGGFVLKIIAIGDRDMVVGFKLAGISSALEVKNPEEAKAALKDAFQRRDTGIILISERLAEELRSFISKLVEGANLPIIVEIPGKEGTRTGGDVIKELVKKAVGIEIKI